MAASYADLDMVNALLKHNAKTNATNMVRVESLVDPVRVDISVDPVCGLRR